MPLSDQLKQLVELHKAAELAMKDLIVWLWPVEPLPSIYFGLVKRLGRTLRHQICCAADLRMLLEGSKSG